MSSAGMDQMRALTCAEVEDLLPLVVDGVLDAEDEPQVFEHLAGCEACQDSLRAYDLIDLGLAGPRLPARARPRLLRLPLPAALAAGLLLTVGLAAAGWFARSGMDPAVPTPARSAPAPVRATAVAAPAATPAPAKAAAGEAEIIQVIWPGPGRRMPVYIVREGDRLLVIDQARLDGGQALSGTRDGASMVAMPAE